MKPEEKRGQAISFAYGNLKIDRPDLKREDVERVYDQAINDNHGVQGTLNQAIADALFMRPRTEPLFYIQDTRSCVGNSALWWREGGHGYTSNLNEAWKVPGWTGRETDVLRSCAEMDALAERHVDVQKLPAL